MIADNGYPIIAVLLAKLIICAACA